MMNIQIDSKSIADSNSESFYIGSDFCVHDFNLYFDLLSQKIVRCENGLEDIKISAQWVPVQVVIVVKRVTFDSNISKILEKHLRIYLIIQLVNVIINFNFFKNFTFADLL